MSTVSMHPVEYIRVHLHYQDIRGGLIEALNALHRKASVPVERAAAIAIVLLMAALVIAGFMKIGTSVTAGASFSSAISEMVVPPVPAIPSGV